MRKLTILLGILAFHCTAIFAQTKEIKGKVIDAKDLSPLTGVTITAKGSRSAALSTANGSFSIKVNARATSLHLTYIGYEDKDIPIDGSSEPITIRLQTAQRALSEVVVVGYGKAAKKDITGSITKLNAKDIENFPAPSFESAIQGKAPGVVVLSGSGKVGQAIQINIRGLSSISAGTQPLYVIDGLPVTTASLSDMTNDPTNPLADINPNDIESLEILKDASAAAIYGARAANGVVLITTRKGKNAQKTAFELNTSTGISNPARQRKYLNAQQYVGLINQSVQSDANYDFNNLHSFSTLDSTISYYQSNYYPVMDELALGTDWQHAAVNTDWQKLSLHKNAPNNQVNISATGGNDKTRFFISGFYNTQQAIVINNRFSRYGARFNLDHNASDKLVFGLNMAVDRSQLDKVTFDNSLSSPGELVAQVPISPVIDPNTGQLNNNTLYQNGLYDAQYDHDKQVTYRMLGNAYANYTIIPSLSFRSEIGTDLLNLTENEFQGKESQDGAGVGKAQTILSQSVSLNTNNYFTFTPHIDDNNKLSTVLGMSYLQNDLLQSNANAQNFPSDAIKNLSGATNVTGAASTNYRYTFLSYFLRANYSFMNRYLLSASIRTDGSSRFSPAHRYGWFPAASAGWVISEEDFLKHSTAVSMLKLRASYGLTGNSEIGESQFQSLYSVTNYPNMPGYTPLQLANPNLRWEKSQQTDIGLDYGFLKNRISGEIDYYKKHTTDLLLNTNIPFTTGYFVFPPPNNGTATYYQNLGTMNNEGFEFAITSQNLVGQFKWTTSFNIAYNKNRVGNIGGQVITSLDQLQHAVEGQPIGTFYMQKFLGVDPANGDALYADPTGKPTNDYNSAGRFAVGKYQPDYTGGITNTFSYKGFDLSAFFYFVTGNKIYNAAGIYMTDGFAAGNFDNQTTDLLNAWKKPGDITNVPRVGSLLAPDGGQYSTGGFNSTRFLYDGKYMRLKNLTFGYTLPGTVSSTLRISSARIYVSAVNMFTFTKYPGDPEVSTAVIGRVSGGEDFYTIPQAKTFTVGLNVKF